MKKKIIIAGYPKSGNSWLTKLTAELIGCPVKHFLYEPHNCYDVEGVDRKSMYEVYKSHHQYFELSENDKAIAKIIYIYRDPRDVVISGSYFFFKKRKIINYIKLNHTFVIYSICEKGLNFLISMLNKFLLIIGYKLIYRNKSRKKMINAVLFGDSNVNRWCKPSWKTHIESYINKNDILKIKYEDLLNDTFKECNKILKFINEERSEVDIRTAIKNQSFMFLKKKYKNEKHEKKHNFLRKGNAGEWRRHFSKKEKQKFEDNLSEELRFLGYDI